MKTFIYLTCFATIGLFASSAMAQTKDPELNKCISQYQQIESDLEGLEAKLNDKQKASVKTRRVNAVNAFQAVRPRTLQSCKTYLGTIGTIKMDIQNKRI